MAERKDKLIIGLTYNDTQQGDKPSMNEKIKLCDIQNHPELIATFGLTTLAWLAHEAESDDDDVSQMNIHEELERRGNLAYKIWRDEYMRLWPEHAKFKNYQSTF